MQLPVTDNNQADLMVTRTTLLYIGGSLFLAVSSMGDSWDERLGDFNEVLRFGSQC
jgi:hypothetical protein